MHVWERSAFHRHPWFKKLQTPKPFYITLRRTKDPALWENYASKLYRVMILHLLRAGLTSWDSTVRYGRVHFTCSQKIILLCMKNWRKNLFQATWTQLYRPFLKERPDFNFFIHWMIHLPSSSVAMWRAWPSLQSKVWKRYNSVDHFWTTVMRANVNPTQVHIQITISQYS